MGYRVVLFSASDELPETLIESARHLGFEVVTSYQSEGVWDRRSSIIDFQLALFPKTKQSYIEVLRDQLGGGLGITTFDGLEKFPVMKVWRVVGLRGSGGLFGNLVRGMRQVGVRFQDWDLDPEGELSSLGEQIPARGQTALIDCGIGNVALLRRLSNADLVDIPGLGDLLRGAVRRARDSL